MKDLEPILNVLCNYQAGFVLTPDELGLLSEHICPFAIVMGTKGHTAMERALFGSNTLTAIKKLHWPVICVPPGKEFGKGI